MRIFGWLAAFDLVPFGGGGDQLAVGVAAGDVGDQCRGERVRLGHRVAFFLDGAVVGELAQHALELDAIGVLQAELARNFAGPDLSGICLDEGDDGAPVGKAMVILAFHLTSNS
jgi:hypothetical protein